ncbi:phospholipid carrier-dependent glycosyltransferase [Duganella sp. FT50W]|uniref:Phospholipid carrier-dependent glycosyltransferase n=1 Tax=Duganella lactea TaxID=2692173 RepID=A0A6L8MNA0_9BURK|nr:glycosyltransferase family 39 protein [Duganella lactea]MYM83432.1 phospholipid carrier-dependent glycosyltransferase [Duganella lactea]
MPVFFRSKAALFLLAAVFIVCSLLVLDVRTLIPPDEGRYAEMAREMLLTGDWITTRLNGIKYFEKPPLHTWMSAVAFTLFGLGDWQARLWNGVCGIGGVFLVAYTGRRVFGERAGLYAALVLGSTLFWAAASQFNSLDLPVAASMALILCALLLAQRDDATAVERRNWMLLCWAGMALSVLTKGLIGVVLPGGVLAIYMLVSGDRAILRRLHLFSGLALLLLIAVPWFLLVGARNPEQPHFFFIHEHWDRFFLKTHHREGPWYYFLVLMLPATIPWLPLLPVALVSARKRVTGRFQPTQMLLVWTVFILFFFSYSSSKLPGYMLPVFPAMALLTGVYLARAPRSMLLLVAGLLAVVGLVGLGCVRIIPHLNTALLLAGFGAALLCGLAAWFAEARGQRVAAVLAVAVGGWLLTQLLMASHEQFGRVKAGRDAALAIRGELRAETPVYSVGTYEQSMTFYMGHTVIPVNYVGELEFGLLQEPGRGIASLDEFYARWRATAAQGQPQYAIIREDLYAEARRQGLPMRERARGSEVVVVSSP